MVSLLLGAFALAGCGPADTPGGGGSPAVTRSPAVEGSIAPLTDDPALADLGLEQATMSVEAADGGWLDDDEGITYLEPWEREDPSVTVVRIGYDGQERWRETVGFPDDSSTTAYPRLSQDEGLGVVSVWFATSSSGGTQDFAGDITWFDTATGEGGVMPVDRQDGELLVATWDRLVGYVSGPVENGAPNQTFTYLGPSMAPVTREWESVLRDGEQSWLSAVVSGQPSYTVFGSEDPDSPASLRYGLNVILNGGVGSMRWYLTPHGEHAVTGAPGSDMIVVDAEGSILLDYAGDCRTSSGSIAGGGSQLWSGALHFDAATGAHTCLSALEDEGATIMGMTSGGIAMGQGFDGRMMFSEPQYNTTVESELEGMMWPRGNYLLLQTDGDEDTDLVSAFNDDDLRLG